MSDKIPKANYVVPRIIRMRRCNIGRQAKSVLRYAIDGAHDRIVGNLPFFGTVVHGFLETHVRETKTTTQRGANS